MKNTEKKKCELCEREVNKTSNHHLVPQQKGTDKRKARLCIPCSKQVHALFTNRELKKLDTIEKLKAETKVQKWIAWISKRTLENIKYSGKGGFHK